MYDGVVTLDAKGEATVELPEFFDSLNGDFRYLVTPIGAPEPNLCIAEEVLNNRFKIAVVLPARRYEPDVRLRIPLSDKTSGLRSRRVTSTGGGSRSISKRRSSTLTRG